MVPADLNGATLDEVKKISHAVGDWFGNSLHRGAI